MNAEMIYGLITGTFFGFFLQKGGVVKYDKQIAALRFQDMTIIKFMMSAIIVGMVGVHFFDIFGLVRLLYKPVVLVHFLQTRVISVGHILFLR